MKSSGSQTSDNMPQTCNRQVIDFTPPPAGRGPVNTPVIVDEASALLKAARIHRDNKLRGQTGETPSQPVLLHLLMSRAKSRTGEPAKWYRVLLPDLRSQCRHRGVPLRGRGSS